MPAQILNGKRIAEQIQQHIRARIDAHVANGHRPPGLAVIMVGNDPASEIYVRNKHLACEKVGIFSQLYQLSPLIPEASLIALIDELNAAPNIDGILVQLPLPAHIDRQNIIESIRPEKDVDGFHPYNLGRLAQQSPLLRPCTPFGIMELLKTTEIDLKGLTATVVGTSNIVGLPMLLELLIAGCTVTACHRLTTNLPLAVQNADLLIVAAGSPELIKGEWVKPGAIIIDVGMNRMDNGQLVGDVEFEQAKSRAAYITPVPGGVGPMTVTALLTNTLYAYKTLHLKTSPIVKMENQ